MQINKKNHFGVYAIIIKNDLILLIKKSRGPYKGTLDLPGGRPEHGETILETIAREVMEETGVAVYKVQLFNNYSTVATEIIQPHIQEQIHHIGAVYVVESFDDSALETTMDSEDSLGAQWFSMACLTKEELSPFAYQAITDIKNRPIESPMASITQNNFHKVFFGAMVQKLLYFFH